MTIAKDAIRKTGALSRRLELSFAREERAGLMLAAKIRFAVVAFALAWQSLRSPLDGAALIFELCGGSVFLMTGALLHYAAKQGLGGRRFVYALFAFDILWMAFFMALSNPFLPEGVSRPPSLILVSHNFLWFYVLLLQAGFALSPGLVIWSGLWILIARAAQVGYVLSTGDFVTEDDLRHIGANRVFEAWFNPRFISNNARIAEFTTTVGATITLAGVAWRTRTLVASRAETERQRAQVARYLSPDMVETVLSKPEALQKPRTANAAVLFADICGFTRMAEGMPADEVSAILKEFYKRLSHAVFQNHGTLDKFLGDGLMATFGALTPSDSAPGDALAAGFAMLEEIDDWNRERATAGLAPIRLSVGVHYGPVVAGDLGEERVEFAVIGDTVNVASRAESATRALEARIAATTALVDAARDANPALAARLTHHGPVAVKGREGEIDLWVAR